MGEGARGFIIKDIQSRLNIYVSGSTKAINPDGVYGRRDTAHLVSLAKDTLGYTNTEGSVIEEDFYPILMDQPFPDLFTRCLNISSAFENTYFGGLAVDDKHSAVYYGIIGYSGKEIYRLLCMFTKREPAAFSLISDVNERNNLKRILDDRHEDTGTNYLISLLLRKYKFWRGALAEWGKSQTMRDLQIQLAYQYWKDSQERLLNIAPDLKDNERAQALFFDCQVQNGGVRQFAAKRYAKFVEGESFITDEEKMLFLVEEIVSAALPRWQLDVRKRKTLFAYGVSTIHGKDYKIANFGFLE